MALLGIEVRASDIDVQNKQGRCSQHHAAVEVSLANGANVKLRDLVGVSTFHYAIQYSGLRAVGRPKRRYELSRFSEENGTTILRRRGGPVSKSIRFTSGSWSGSKPSRYPGDEAMRHAGLIGSFMESDTSYKTRGFSFAFESLVSEHGGTNYFPWKQSLGTE